jgi:N-hydroxyarylamine O-acetyltransferase
MNVQTYLDRINYDGPLVPTAEALRRLQVAHLLTVPFENLSIHAHEPIVLEDEALFRKIVSRRRGGVIVMSAPWQVRKNMQTYFASISGS